MGKVPAPKPDTLKFNFWYPDSGRKADYHRLSSDLHTYVVSHKTTKHTQMHILKYIKM